MPHRVAFVLSRARGFAYLPGVTWHSSSWSPRALCQGPWWKAPGGLSKAPLSCSYEQDKRVPVWTVEIWHCPTGVPHSPLRALLTAPVEGRSGTLVCTSTDSLPADLEQRGEAVRNMIIQSSGYMLLTLNKTRALQYEKMLFQHHYWIL